MPGCSCSVVIAACGIPVTALSKLPYHNASYAHLGMLRVVSCTRVYCYTNGTKYKMAWVSNMGGSQIVAQSRVALGSHLLFLAFSAF